MASVEDLVSGLSGGVHVSQDGYELKALQEYLRQTITIPNIISTSPVNYTSRPQPASRSTSTTRKHNSFPQSLLNDTSSQPYPSPSINSHGNTSFFHSAEDISTTGQISRPTALRRTSSYGFGGSKEHPITASSSALPAPSPAIDSGFEYDAFAPMYQQPANSWNGTSHQQASGSSNPWSAFSGQSSAFGHLQQSQSQFTQFAPQSEKFGSFANRPSQVSERVVPVEEEAEFGYDDDDMMDEDRAEDGIIDDMDEEDRVEMAMGLGSGEEDRRYQYGYGGWDRGRQ